MSMSNRCSFYYFFFLVSACFVTAAQYFQANVAPHLIPAALNSHGTRAVQKILEVCRTDAQVNVVTNALRGSVVPLSTDANGNHVIQQCLQYLPLEACGFIFDEMTTEARIVSKHRHGCCVVQRCIDIIQGEPRRRLLARICKFALELMQNAFGNYVVQYMLDACGGQAGDPDGNVSKVVAQVLPHMAMLAQQKYSSNVVEVRTCFVVCWSSSSSSSSL